MFHVTISIRITVVKNTKLTSLSEAVKKGANFNPLKVPLKLLSNLLTLLRLTYLYLVTQKQ